MSHHTVTYRELPATEIELLRPLWQKLNDFHASVSEDFASDFRDSTFENRKQRLLNEKSRLYIVVAEDDSRLVGYAVGSLTEGGPKPRGELDSMYVEPDYRGSGIGRELAIRVLDWIDGHGVDNVVIAVVSGNEEALRFYERLGFVPRAYTLRRKPQADE